MARRNLALLAALLCIMSVIFVAPSSEGQGSGSEPKEIVIASLMDQEFAVTWLTDGAVTGSVYWADVDNPSQWNSTDDIRGKDVVSKTHLCRVSGGPHFHHGGRARP